MSSLCSAGPQGLQLISTPTSEAQTCHHSCPTYARMDSSITRTQHNRAGELGLVVQV